MLRININTTYIFTKKNQANIILGILYAWKVVGSLLLCLHVFTQRHQYNIFLHHPHYLGLLSCL